MNSQINVAIIGCGWAGVRHALAYRRGGARIAWAVDTNERRASALAQRDIYIPESDTFYLEIRRFLQCIETGQEPITSGRSQRRPLEIVLAAYRSMETGLPVALS